MRRSSVGTAALILCGAVVTVAIAQSGSGRIEGARKLPGEMWRQKMSMKMGSMSMPGRTADVCLPKDNPQQGSKPPGENCTLYDIQSSANRMAAKFRCTGKDEAEGTMQSEKRGNTLITDMNMRARGTEMAMHGEATNLGQACEFVDYSNAKLVMPAQADYCAEAVKKAKFKTDARYVGQDSGLFLGQGAVCAGNKQEIAAYCKAFQTPSGYLSVHVSGKRQARSVANQNAGYRQAGPEYKKLISAVPADDADLQRSVELCGMGKGKAAYAALRTRLLAEAETTKQWAFLIAEGADTKVVELQDVAKENCSGRGFTEAKSKGFAPLCIWYGPDLVAGRFDNARNTAWGERNDEAPPAASSDAANAAADNQQQDSSNSATNVVNKTRKALRGLFGR